MNTSVTAVASVVKKVVKVSKTAKRRQSRLERELNFHCASPEHRAAHDAEIARQLAEYNDLLFA